MIRAVRIASAIFALTAISPALARPWAGISSSHGDNHLVDVGSISDTQGIRRAWIRTTYRERRESGAVRGLDMYAFNCAARELAIAYTSDYDSNGRAVYHEVVPQTRLHWLPAVPDTVGEGFLSFVCSYPIGTDPRRIEGLYVEE